MSDASVPPRWALARVRHAGVQPLEVWNLKLSDRRQLWEVAGTPFVEAQRQRGVADVLIAREIAAAVGEAARQLHTRHRFDRLWLCGGLTSLAGFATAAQAALAIASFEPRVCAAGAFAGELGGRDVLRAYEQPGGVIADVGQTSIKVSVFPADMSTGSRPARILRARRLDELPHRFIGMAPVTPQGALAAVQAAAPWIAEAILDALDAVVPRVVPPTLVLGLPCPVADDLTLGACTYGWEGEASLVPRIASSLATAGAFDKASDVQVLVLNDAELAAASAPASAGTTLTMTIGFGPGAALMQP